ncbi:hypothetical protein MGAST_25990 [Mycobacterium gastri 'Wayne']|nr:hypothetical protein MGAST_25990 [Mycobacterium gastri 'Wayne']
MTTSTIQRGFVTSYSQPHFGGSVGKISIADLPAIIEAGIRHRGLNFGDLRPSPVFVDHLVDLGGSLGTTALNSGLVVALSGVVAAALSLSGGSVAEPAHDLPAFARQTYARNGFVATRPGTTNIPDAGDYP